MVDKSMIIISSSRNVFLRTVYLIFLLRIVFIDESISDMRGTALRLNDSVSHIVLYDSWKQYRNWPADFDRKERWISFDLGFNLAANFKWKTWGGYVQSVINSGRKGIWKQAINRKKFVVLRKPENFNDSWPASKKLHESKKNIELWPTERTHQKPSLFASWLKKVTAVNNKKPDLNDG